LVETFKAMVVTGKRWSTSFVPYLETQVIKWKGKGLVFENTYWQEYIALVECETNRELCVNSKEKKFLTRLARAL